MRRRAFILGSASVAGGVAIGYQWLRPRVEANPLAATLQADQVALTPYVIIDQSGVTVITPRAEMGQGIHGTLATLVAEELDVPLPEVRVEHGPPSEIYSNTVAHPVEPPRGNWRSRLVRAFKGSPERPRRTQLTGGQTSTQDAYVKMRKAGAAARAVLIEAAARELGVDAAELRTEQGRVIHAGGAIPYTQLAAAAAAITPPEDPPLKPRQAWTQLGRSQPRVDMVSKCTGTALYAIDVRLPGMLYGIVRRNPHLGGGMTSVNATRAEQMPGFRKLIPLEDGFIVVATNTWYAMEAAEMVEVEWGPPPYPATNEQHREAVTRALDSDEGHCWRDDGDVDQQHTGESITAAYSVPYLAHATMEPLGAVAYLKQDELEIWAGNQNPTNAQYQAAKIADLPMQAVRVHTTYMGGGFGRRLDMDFVRTAVVAACAIPGIPVKVIWPREEDMTHDGYRPMAAARFRGTVSEGKIAALDLRVASPGLRSSALRRAFHAQGDVADFFDKFGATGAMDQPYKIKHYRVTACPVPRLLPVGWWRSVGESQNSFFHESAIDELAHAAREDPLAMRLALLDHEPGRQVLAMVAKMSQWETPLPEGHGRGVAFALSSGAATAQVIEVSRQGDAIKIEKVFAAVDVGVALDPRNIEAQVQSSSLFGLGAAMHGEITVAQGKVAERNFDDYPLLPINLAPDVTVAIYESEDEIFGVGESATPTSAPALGNAIFAATGRRIRDLPFGKSIKFVS